MRGCVVPLGFELTDIITPKSCSSYIAEIIKYVAYTKQQIPYPYERLKMFVLRRRERQKTREVSSIIAKLCSRWIGLARYADATKNELALDIILV